MNRFRIDLWLVTDKNVTTATVGYFQSASNEKRVIRITFIETRELFSAMLSE